MSRRTVVCALIVGFALVGASSGCATVGGVAVPATDQHQQGTTTIGETVVLTPKNAKDVEITVGDSVRVEQGSIRNVTIDGWDGILTESDSPGTYRAVAPGSFTATVTGPTPPCGTGPEHHSHPVTVTDIPSPDGLRRSAAVSAAPHIQPRCG